MDFQNNLGILLLNLMFDKTKIMILGILDKTNILF